VRRLLHVDAYTIEGVRKLHRQGGLRAGAAASAVEGPSSPLGLERLLADLETAKRRLESLMAVMG
jgi:hypothetical protein